MASMTLIRVDSHAPCCVLRRQGPAKATRSPRCSFRMLQLQPFGRSSPLSLGKRGRRQLTVSAGGDGCEPTIEEMMTRDVLTLRVDQSIKEAVKLFVEKRISGAPVVDDGGKLVGVLSESDLLWKHSSGSSSNFIIPPLYIGVIDTFVYLRDEAKFQEETNKVLALTVGDAMSSKVVTCSPDSPISEAADLMLFKKVNRLPVVDKSNKVVGMMTRSDVLRGMMAGACTIDFGDE